MRTDDCGLRRLRGSDYFRTLQAIRNRIAHVYPDDPDRQTTNLNEAWDAVPDLLAAHDTVRSYLERRLSQTPA